MTITAVLFQYGAMPIFGVVVSFLALYAVLYRLLLWLMERPDRERGQAATRSLGSESDESQNDND